MCACTYLIGWMTLHCSRSWAWCLQWPHRNEWGGCNFAPLRLESSSEIIFFFSYNVSSSGWLSFEKPQTFTKSMTVFTVLFGGITAVGICAKATFIFTTFQGASPSLISELAPLTCEAVRCCWASPYAAPGCFLDTNVPTRCQISFRGYPCPALDHFIQWLWTRLHDAAAFPTSSSARMGCSVLGLSGPALNGLNRSWLVRLLLCRSGPLTTCHLSLVVSVSRQKKPLSGRGDYRAC